MDRQANAWVIAIVLVVGALAVLALRPTSTRTGSLPEVPLGELNDLEPGTAMVSGLRESKGTSIFGIRLASNAYFVTLTFLDDPGCHESVGSGDPWPVSSGACSSVVPITGKISGRGNQGTGESIIGVETEVAGDCYRQLVRGGVWPSPDPACGT